MCACVQVAQGGVDNAILLIERHGRPDVRTADVAPLVRRVVKVRFARLRHGVEGPYQPAGSGIPGANIAARAGRIGLAGARTSDDQILVDRDRIGNGKACPAALTDDFGCDADIGIDCTVAAKFRCQLPGRHIHCHQEAAFGAEDDPWGMVFIARPVSDPAPMDVTIGIILPQHLARFRANCSDRCTQPLDPRRTRGGDVHDPADQEWGHLEPVINPLITFLVRPAPVAIGPGRLKPGNIREVDLVQFRVILVFPAAAIGWPLVFAFRRGKCPQRWSLSNGESIQRYLGSRMSLCQIGGRIFRFLRRHRGAKANHPVHDVQPFALSVPLGCRHRIGMAG